MARKSNQDTPTKQLTFFDSREKVIFENIANDLAAEKKTSISSIVSNAIRAQVSVGEDNIDHMIESMYDTWKPETEKKAERINIYTPGDVVSGVFSIAASDSIWAGSESALKPLLDYMIRNDGICYFGRMDEHVDEGDIKYCASALKQIRDALQRYKESDAVLRKNMPIIYEEDDGDLELDQAIYWFNEFYETMVKDERGNSIASIMGWLRKYWDMICRLTYSSRLACKLAQMTYAWDRNPVYARMELVRVLKTVAPQLGKK